ncbi:Mth938-like domain-containing protein [Aliiroseovarius marinus]|uniref:Mth938-like domain-containing protein n=1 Tax=Aliiroseovarius marinus TaxID=2500159 RepID=UPI003D7E8909
MQFHEVTYDSAQPVDSYGPGFFRVAGKVVHGPVLVTAETASAWGGLDDIDSLTALADQIDVLFLGMGAEIAHPPAALREALEEAGIGIELMGSAAACRTYNVLIAEGRRIALAALPV